MSTCCEGVKWNHAQPGPIALWRVIRSNLPMTTNKGIYNYRSVAGTTRLSAHAFGRALDVGLSALKGDERQIGDIVFETLVRCSKEMGLDHVIWNHQIWSASRGGPRRYTLANQHLDHLHIAFTPQGSQRTSFPRFLVGIAGLRTGLEDLAKSREHLA